MEADTVFYGEILFIYYMFQVLGRIIHDNGQMCEAVSFLKILFLVVQFPILFCVNCLF